MGNTIKTMDFTIEQESSILHLSSDVERKKITLRCEKPMEYGQLTLKLTFQTSTRLKVDEDEQVKIKDETKNKVKDHQEL